MPMISTIALACAGSAAAAVVARWIPKALVPALVFEIAFGIAMGPSGLALLAPGPTMDMLALIGFAVLMLVAGLEIDLGMLLGRSEERRVGKEWVSTCRFRWSPYHTKKKQKPLIEYNR